jgi:hypothetical protein
MIEKKVYIFNLDEERIQGENLDVEWGENLQERILEKLSGRDSERHDCKGSRSETAFDKL